MRKLALSIMVAFAVCVTAAVAQSGSMGGSNQGSQGSSPTMQPGQTQPGQTQPGQAGGPDMGPGASGQEQNGPSANATKGEKKLKGCVQSQSGQSPIPARAARTAARVWVPDRLGVQLAAAPQAATAEPVLPETRLHSRFSFVLQCASLGEGP